MKNISKIISIAFLSFSILLLCYVFYRSQIFHSGTRFDYYFKYYVIVFLFIFFSFISFFIPKKLKINISISLISIVFALFIVEGYLIISEDSTRIDKSIRKINSVIYKNKTGKEYDQRSRLEIYNDLKKEDPNIVVTIYPSLLKYDKNLDYLPLSGLSNRKTIFCNENGYYALYKSDRYGFNNPDEEWDKEKIDYLLIGDSFVHGECVNEPDTISGNLRKLNNSENGVLNLGMGMNESLLEYATLKEYFPTKKVKRVLWLYYANDLAGLKAELENQILVNYLNDKNFTQNLILKKQKVEKILFKKLEQEVLKQEYNSRSKTFILIRFVKLNSIRKILFPYISQDPEPIKEFRDILKLSNEFTKQNNSKLYFIYLPSFAMYDNKKNSVYHRELKQVAHVVESLNIPLIDVHKKLFEKHNDPLSLFPFRKNGHYNELGYQLVSETIFNKIHELER